MSAMERLDRKIVVALQAGLPLETSPWQSVAAKAGAGEPEVIERIRRMLDKGAIRRIAAVPNHYRMGMVANGMSVWDVEDDRAEEMGKAIGALTFVSHCYRRPRHVPDWPYNLFAMLHGKTRDEVEEKRFRVAALLGNSCRANDILYSTRILKKTGLRLKEGGDTACSD